MKKMFTINYYENVNFLADNGLADWLKEQANTKKNAQMTIVVEVIDDNA